MRRTLLLCACAMLFAALPAISAAQGRNEGPPPGPMVALTQQVELDKAAFIEDLLAKFAETAAAKGLDEFLEIGRSRLASYSAADLVALSESASDFETFYQTAFLGYSANALGDASADLVFYPLAPCRLYDSRIATTAGLVGPMAPSTTRSISVNDSLSGQGGNAAGCGAGLANDPPALSIVLSSVGAIGNGNLRTFAAGTAVPTAATLVYNTGLLASTGTITPSAVGVSSELSIRNQGGGTTDVVVDVNGYFTRATFGPANGVIRAAAHITLSGTTPSVTRYFNLYGTAVTVTRLGLGTYEVNFGSNITGRYYGGTPGNASSGVPATSFINITPRAGVVNALYVELMDAAGANIDTSFYIQVY